MDIEIDNIIHYKTFLLLKALESDIVSSQLHKWIDLIFGFKQRGTVYNAWNVTEF